MALNYLYQLKSLPNLTEENGVWIDRKLNVALTRARKKLYITGVPDILNHNLIYRRLIQAINKGNPYLFVGLFLLLYFFPFLFL